MAAKQRDKSEDFSNPALYSGLKFYDVYTEKQRFIARCAYIGDLYQWHVAMLEFYSSTSSWISTENKTKLDAMFKELGPKIRGYLINKDRLGNRAQFLYSVLKDKLFELQRLLNESTKHLNLKDSSGDNGKFDVRHLFST